MGILGKLFGSKKKPKTQPTPQAQPTQEQKPVVKIEGEIPQANFRSEAQEIPKTVQCKQCEYGKTLQSPRGPIRPGVEHGFTGKSADFPEGTVCHPNMLFKHAFNSGRPYPWAEEGGEIAKRIITGKDGKHYVVVGRRMLRPEDGEEGPKRGRDYTEMHQVVIPAEEWSVAIVPQLSDILKAEGLTESDPAMPPIEVSTDILDQRLPHGWLDDLSKELISNIVSGKPISIQEWDLTQKEFLQKLFNCLICLPEKLARQVSFGAGFADYKKGEVRVAHTARAKSEIRKIGKQGWKGAEPDDLTFGRRYLATIIQTLAHAKTPRQVIRLVEEEFPPKLKEELERRFQKNIN